jgi:hypothetical protein
MTLWRFCTHPVIAETGAWRAGIGQPSAIWWHDYLRLAELLRYSTLTGIAGFGHLERSLERSRIRRTMQFWRKLAIDTIAGRDCGDPSHREPIMAIVSLSNQRVTIYDADGWILRAPVSSGQTGYETPAGVYSVIQKEEEHYSNLSDDASMPFMQRVTWSGIALHAGPLPGYPASHGCVRMPYEFAQRLFDMTKIGMRVIVARNDIRPVEIDHPVLFKPKLVRADLALKALTAHWDAAREEAQAAAPFAHAKREA